MQAQGRLSVQVLLLLSAIVPWLLRTFKWLGWLEGNLTSLQLPGVPLAVSSHLTMMLDSSEYEMQYAWPGSAHVYTFVDILYWSWAVASPAEAASRSVMVFIVIL